MKRKEKKKKRRGKKEAFRMAYSHPPEMQGASASGGFAKALGYGKNAPKMRLNPSRRRNKNFSGTNSL